MGGANTPTDPTRSSCRMQGTGENMDGGVELHSTIGTEEARDWIYPLTIGMEGATEG